MTPESPHFDPGQAESIEDAAKREMDADLAWREHESSDDDRRTEREADSAWRLHETDATDSEYEGLSAESKARAIRNGVPGEVIRAAAEHGITLDYLIHAKTSPAAKKRLAELRIDWGAEAEPDHDDDEAGLTPPAILGGEKLDELTPEQREHYIDELDDYLGAGIERAQDPIFYLEAKGIKKKLEVAQLADRIETEPRAVKKELKRPGELSKVLRDPIIGRRIGRLLLARSMHRQELRERKEKGLGKNYEDGLLRIGIPRTRRNLAYIKRHDEDVKVLRNKLRPWNSHEYRGPEKQSARRDLAELIHRTRQDQEALRKRQIHHEDVYFHKQFSQPYKDFAARKSARGR